MSWIPSTNMYHYEIAAICGVTNATIREAIKELLKSGKIKPDYLKKNVMNYRAATELIKYFEVDCSNEQQILQILTIEREKRYQRLSNFKKSRKNLQNG